MPSLADATGGRIGTSLDVTLPALRVALVGYQGSPATGWEAAPMFQVEVWADDEGTAESIAWTLANNWPSAEKREVPGGTVNGRWIVQLPISLPPDDGEAQDTDKARYMVNVALRLTSTLPLESPMADTVHIATENIYAAPGILAFTKGMVVPADAVENLKVQDKVASQRTKAAAEAIESLVTPES